MTKYFTFAALLCLAGCTSMNQGTGGAEAAGTWFSPPAEYPGICMRLAPGGTLEFVGGFTFFNPGRWSFDRAALELRIELGGSGPFPTETAAQLKKRPDSLLRADVAARTLVYRLKASTESIEIGGFVFHRKLACK